MSQTIQNLTGLLDVCSTSGLLVKATSPLWHESCTLVAHGALEVMDTLQSEP